jgi:PAS domain S-box-containing protein
VIADLDYFASLVHPGDQPYVRAKLAAALESGSYESEFRVPWPDGSVHVLAAHAETSFEGGKPVRMTGVCWDVTDRKAAETALRASAAKLKEAQAIAHVGYWESNLDTREMTGSDETLRIFGLDPDNDSLTFERCYAMVPPEDRKAIQDNLERTLRTGEPYNSTQRIILEDGSTRYIERRGRISSDGGAGAAAKLVGTVLDVTQRTMAEIALRESWGELDQRVRVRTEELGIANRTLSAKVQELERSEQRFQCLIQATSQIIWTNNAQGRMEGVQPGWAAFTGQTQNEYKEYGWFTAVHSDDRQSTIEKWRLAIGGSRHFVFEHRVRRHDGVYRRFSISAVPVMDDDGSIREWVGVHNDITERRQQEEEIQAKEAKFRFLAESVPQIVWTARPDGWLDYYNQRWFTYSGMTLEETQGWGWEPVLHPDDLQQIVRAWTHAVKTGDPFQVESRFKRASDGAYRWHLCMALPLRDEFGQILKWFGTGTDINDYKDAEAKNLSLREELEVRVHQRTADLERANRELKTASSKLEQSNRELENFASVASHDLQEPLRKVQAFGDRLKTLLSGNLQEQGEDYLNRMLNAASRMQSLVQDLLIFSRVASPACNFVNVDLTAVTREVLSDLEVGIAENGAMVEAGDLPTIQADPLQMRQLLQNLIANGLKFHKKGMPAAISVRAEDVDASEGVGCIRLLVEDNGIGFDEKYLDRIFTVFQRLHSRSEYEGTGVGLAICRKIAHRHGGAITAASAPDHGAVFKVILPRTHSPSDSGSPDS